MRNILSIAAVVAALGASGGAQANSETTRLPFTFSGSSVPAMGNYVYDPTVANASFTGSAGLEYNALGFASSPDGQAAAFLQAGVPLQKFNATGPVTISPISGPLSGSMSVTFGNLPTDNTNMTLSFEIDSPPVDGLFQVNGVPTLASLTLTVSEGDKTYSLGSQSASSWTPEAMTFSVTGPSATFTFAATSNTLADLIAIDDIKLTYTTFTGAKAAVETGGVEGVAAVPELSTWALMLAGFAGLSFASCRQRKNAAAAV